MATAITANTGITDKALLASLIVISANSRLEKCQNPATEITHVHNLAELRDREEGGENISFQSQGCSEGPDVARNFSGDVSLFKENKNAAKSSEKHAVDYRHSEAISKSNAKICPSPGDPDGNKDGGKHHQHHHNLFNRDSQEKLLKKKWNILIKQEFTTFWNFVRTPAGFIITIYFLNIVAWGVMLFFLLLKAAPAMNHPTADNVNSPRKIWLEIDSQILNALFCVTNFGFAPWRFRDLYYFTQSVHFTDRNSMRELVEANKSWFKPPVWYTEDSNVPDRVTFSGQVAPPTPLWKLDFTIWMVVLNTLVQAVLCYFMWHYSRLERPSWAAATFMGLGCCVAMLAGVMSWWEGRKVTRIEGSSTEMV